MLILNYPLAQQMSHAGLTRHIRWELSSLLTCLNRILFSYCSSLMFSPLIWQCLLATKREKPRIPVAPINKHEDKEAIPFWKMHDGRWAAYRPQHSRTITAPCYDFIFIYFCSPSLSTHFFCRLKFRSFFLLSFCVCFTFSGFFSSFIWFVFLCLLLYMSAITVVVCIAWHLLEIQFLDIFFFFVLTFVLKKFSYFFKLIYLLIYCIYIPLQFPQSNYYYFFLRTVSIEV